MKTSSFAAISRHPDENAVGIALKPPSWWSGKNYPDLMPSDDLFKASHFPYNLDPTRYKREYLRLFHSRTTPQQIYEDLKDSTLLCFERHVFPTLDDTHLKQCYHEPERFCHRRIVAEIIFDALGVVVEEDDAYKPYQLPAQVHSLADFE